VSAFSVRSWSLRGRVVALCVAVGAVLSALAVVAAVTAQRSNDNVDQLINKAGPIRTAGESLNAAMINQETGIRGYAISGGTANLQPYVDGLASQNQLLAQIRDLLEPGGDPGVTAALADVQAQADAWRSSVATPVIAAVRGRGPDAGKAIIDAANSSQFDQVRRSVTALQAQIVIYRQRIVAAAKGTSRTLVSILIAAAGIIVLAGAALLLVLDRLVTQPVVDLASQVRDVAAGNYDRRIASAGSPELKVLADDVDGMRRQIAAELAEVRDTRGEVEWINEQLKIQTAELTRSNRDLEQFAYVASHDLQEPLRKVASFCQLLQRRYAGQLDERADQYIAFAVDGAQRMQRLINDLLAFSRIGRFATGFTDVDLNRVLAEVTSQLEPRAGAGGEILWSGLPVVEGEESLLTTLFVNVIGNALKFRRPGVPPVVRVSAEREGEDGQWRITVRDNGIGIEREFADKVFVIFQRLHARDTYEGTGIGLAIVKKIVEYHGGRIWLDLDVEDGTSINFTVPATAEIPGAPAPAEPMKEVTT